MHRFFSSVTAFVLDCVCTPRNTHTIVRSLTLEGLQALVLHGSHTGLLPYHERSATALVWELKYHASARAAALAGALLAETLAALAAEELGEPLLIPIPMHPKRRRVRGHNQCELLCGAALRVLGGGITYAPEALVRVGNRAPQQSLPKHKRLKNVHHTMEATVLAKGRVCIVVDDVTTTGATLDEAKRALKAAGARRVHCLALAQS